MSKDQPLSTLPAALQEFQTIFPAGPGTGARIHAVRAPGRINLIGEHIDYNDGVVLPMAIEPHVLVIARARKDSTVRLASTAFADEVVEFDAARPIVRGPEQWANYARGMMRGLIEVGIPVCGADLLICNTLPVGSGLSSSAAILVGIGAALLSVGGNQMEPERLALIAHHAERDFAGVPCGIMDQTIVATAKAGHALMLDCRDRSRQFVPIDPLELRLVVANTGIRHQLADGAYEQRVKSCEAALAHFRRGNAKVGSLRDVAMSDLPSAQAALDEQTFRRCRHVVTEIARAIEAVDLLRLRRYDEVGELMCASHRSLRDDYEVSCEELNFLSDRAMEVKGVYGARMTGAGFGGCAIALAQPRACDALVAHLRQTYATQFGKEPEVFATAAASGVAVVQ